MGGRAGELRENPRSHVGTLDRRGLRHLTPGDWGQSSRKKKDLPKPKRWGREQDLEHSMGHSGMRGMFLFGMTITWVHKTDKMHCSEHVRTAHFTTGLTLLKIKNNKKESNIKKKYHLLHSMTSSEEMALDFEIRSLPLRTAKWKPTDLKAYCLDIQGG